MPPNIDDPRLTAYALGELDGPEYAADHAEMRSLIAADGEARLYVEELRATAASLRSELSLEIAPGLDEGRRAAILGERANEFELVPDAPLDAPPPQPVPPPMRIRYNDDVDDAEGRDDVYHVITHPVPEPRRYRHNLIAVAAAVAIVTTTLTLLVSSLFRNYGGYPGAGNGNPSAIATMPAGPQFVAAPATRPAEKSAPVAATEFPEDDTSKSPRELFAVMPADDATARQAFTSISLTPMATKATPPATNPSAPPAGGAYALSIENPFFETSRNPLSSFAYNVGTDSYGAIQKALASRQLPSRAAVRIEEMVNFFPYDYAAPTGSEAFASHIEVASCPWSPTHRLVRVGLKARVLKQQEKDELVADDLRIRVEFNPALVGAYRLIGYDRRYLSQGASDAERTNQIHSGQTVTALYEVVPVGQRISSADEPLKYQKPAELTAAAAKSRKELLTVKLKYTDLQLDPARFQGYRTQEFAVVDKGTNVKQASDDFKFAAAVAGFGMVLRESPHRGTASYDSVLALAGEAVRRPDSAAVAAGDRRAEFLDLVQQARQIRG
jgi:hypothetical protein